MYDKGNNLRIEVTINNPRDFKILKTKEQVEDGKIIQTREWVPMGKSIANLYRYVEISRSITRRYIEALPEIDTDKVPVKDIEAISRTKEVNGRRHTGFSILSKETTTLFRTIASGDFLINGFDNKSIRGRLFVNDNLGAVGKTTRLLARLRAHGLIKNVNAFHYKPTNILVTITHLCKFYMTVLCIYAIAFKNH